LIIRTNGARSVQREKELRSKRVIRCGSIHGQIDRAICVVPIQLLDARDFAGQDG
jgi:hypothetical protein